MDRENEQQESLVETKACGFISQCGDEWAQIERDRSGYTAILLDDGDSMELSTAQVRCLHAALGKYLESRGEL